MNHLTCIPLRVRQWQSSPSMTCALTIARAISVKFKPHLRDMTVRQKSHHRTTLREWHDWSNTYACMHACMSLQCWIACMNGSSINLFWASNMHSQVTKSENNFHKVNSSCMVIRICHAWRATTLSIMASTAHSAMATYLAQVFFSPCMLGLTSVFYACSQRCSNMLTESSKAHVLSIHSFSMRDKTLQLSWRLERPRKIGMCMYDCCNLTASAKYVLHAWQNILLQGYHIEIPQQRPSMNCSHGKTHCIHFNRTATAKYTHLANMDHI